MNLISKFFCGYFEFIKVFWENGKVYIVRTTATEGKSLQTKTSKFRHWKMNEETENKQ